MTTDKKERKRKDRSVDQLKRKHSETFLYKQYHLSKMRKNKHDGINRDKFNL